MPLTLKLSVCMLAVGALLATSVSNAQAPVAAKRVSPAETFIQTLKPAGQTPRTPDGHPDLTGTWGGFPPPAGPAGRRSNEALEPDQAVMERGSAWNKPPYKPEFWAKVEGLDFGKVDVDPAFHCVSQGVPRLGPPSNILQSAKEIWFYSGTQLRQIPIDGRARNPDDADYDTYLGIPLGHWEGDTLVIESTGFTDNTWLGWEGYFHSNRMTVVERIRRDGDILHWEATVTDPKVLSEPWTMEPVVRRLNKNPGARINEAPPCNEMDLDQIVDQYFRG